MISVIIPAYNEENVISETLSSLNSGNAGSFEVIVVCNGCTDSTPEKVKGFVPAIRCLETPIASKTNALNLGDSAASFFPRIYLDADVILKPDAVLKIGKSLSNGKYLAASPRMQMVFSGTSWAVRGYYSVWQQLPYVEEGMIGTGVYALSEEGKYRVGRFPQIIADDGFVRANFTSSERVVIKDATSFVRAPRNLSNLIKIKTRSRLGQYELRMKYPHLIKNEDKPYGRTMLGLAKHPLLWPELLVYLYVNGVTRSLAKRQIRRSGFEGWLRDISSRE